VASVPVDLGGLLAASGVLGVASLPTSLLRAAAAAVEKEVAPAGEDKAGLAGLLAARALMRAFERAQMTAVELQR
jgi:hypothetical protein